MFPWKQIKYVVLQDICIIIYLISFINSPPNAYGNLWLVKSKHPFIFRIKFKFKFQYHFPLH